MRGLNLALAVVPLLILWLLVPAFKASSFPPVAKGGVIGLYLSLSLIGVYEMGYQYISERLSDK